MSVFKYLLQEIDLLKITNAALALNCQISILYIKKRPCGLFLISQDFDCSRYTPGVIPSNLLNILVIPISFA